MSVSPKPLNPIKNTETIDRLWPFLPPESTQKQPTSNKTDLFVTTTFAISLDGQLSAYKDRPTSLSGPQSKAITGILRLAHDGILIGVGTALADNPRLLSTYPVIKHLSTTSTRLRPMLSSSETA